MRRQLLQKMMAGAAASIAMAYSLGAPAAGFPDGPITIVAPSGPGLLDMLARTVAEQLGKRLHTTVVVENQAGAGGNIGAATVARARPTGSTLLLADSGIMTLNDRLYDKLSYDARTDFEPITLVARVPMVLVVPYGSPMRTFQDFLAAAKARSDGLFYASAGKGTGGDVTMRMLEHTAGVRLQHVPYKGSADAATALASSQVDVLFNNFPTLNAYLQGKRVRALAVTSDEPIQALPGVPTVAQSGLEGFTAAAWFSLVAPRGTPPEALEKIEAAVVEGLKSPELVQRFAQMGVQLTASGRSDFLRMLASERQRVAALAAAGAFNGD